MSAALDRLSELERGATKPPWATPGSSTQLCYDIDPDVAGVGETGFGGVWNYADAAFISAARNALPALLAVARAAEACESEWTGLGALDGPDDLDDDFDALRAALAALDAP